MTTIGPTTVNRTLPIRLPNSSYRVREYLTDKEVEKLIEAAKKRGRNGLRDSAANRLQPSMHPRVEITSAYGAIRLENLFWSLLSRIAIERTIQVVS
jgi:hypothetical protein